MLVSLAQSQPVLLQQPHVLTETAAATLAVPVLWMLKIDQSAGEVVLAVHSAQALWKDFAAKLDIRAIIRPCFAKPIL